MTNVLFNWIITTSAMSVVLSFLIIAVKLVFKDKLPAKWHYYIWMLLIVRLLLPFNIESSLSIFNLSLPKEIGTIGVNTQFQNNRSPIDSSTSSGNSSSSGVLPDDIIQKDRIDTDSRIDNPKPPIKSGNNSESKDLGNENSSKTGVTTGSTKNHGSRMNSFMYVTWMIGAMLFFLIITASNTRYYLAVLRTQKSTDPKLIETVEEWKTKMGIKKDVALVVTDIVKTPTLIGVIRPRILIPEKLIDNLKDEEIGYIILHELNHLKSKDILVKWIKVAAQILHWFNPFVWYSFYIMDQDCEVACDARVLKHLEPQEHRKYGNTIIKLLEAFSSTRYIPGSVGMLENKSSLKRRIKMISIFNKKTGIWSLVALLLLVSIAAIGLTNGKQTDSVPTDMMDSKDPTEDVVELVFNPITIENLQEGQPHEDWKLVDTIALKDFAAKLHLYQEEVPDSFNPEGGHIHGFVEHDGKLYQVDQISSYGINSVDIKLMDWTKDGRNEIQISGGLGATYVIMKIISFDEETKEWLSLLTMDNPMIIDLDKDGTDELLGVSMGSLPGWVDIYRWNGKDFEMASVTEATGNTYAYVLNTGFTAENNYQYDGDWIIETGKWEADKEHEPVRYKLEFGSRLARISDLIPDPVAQKVVEDHFKYWKDKNIDMILSTRTEYWKSANIKWDFSNLEDVRIISIQEEDKDWRRNSYLTLGRGATNKTTDENLKVYRVKYEIKGNNKDISPDASGIHEWWYYVIRKDSNSPWLIDDFGI